MKKFSILLLLICVGGCFKPSQANAQEVPKNPAPSSATPPVVRARDQSSEERKELKEQLRQLVSGARYSELETIAGNFRSTKARFGDGGWKIHAFYLAMGCPEKAPEPVWEAQEKLLRDWVAAYPKSITAHTALADFLTEYAWNARGSGWANTVSDTGRSLFEARLRQALNVLDDDDIAKTKCPEWYSVRLRIALGQGWSRLEYDKLFAEAKEYEPEYYGYDVQKANYLLPRWYGAPGEWEKEAEKDAEKPGGLGLEGYARVIVGTHRYFKNIFKESNASWPKTKDGFVILRKKYPDSLELLNSYALLACLAEDAATAKALFKEINGRMVLSSWKSKEYFILSQNWALGVEQK